MEKLKKNIEQCSVRKGSPMKGVGGGVYGGNLRKMYLLSLEWKRVGVMDNDSGDDETDELRELGWEEWETEWSGFGWRNEAGSLFQRQGDA